ncbi:Aga2p KNAG_0D03640 [Huiozyma naganishii CBS 8797]|uniref:Uncharacterized protein n=1 Tax=Huiozyma naganishii (strain ATCC MYA-139 / BCRC 22969 / CBS 8797 / KCTC 17520 / NBRC 10181 / NCYC 3082 / Yp74L-3) TaxID=1071383 RepID=J7R5I3_HUIN7|nr:hypothetical protein KNAG_0D03640 [Kazachstania naganishii CBS 8797]CCK70110.1 hypothetical protein KNAG_0D03640 [Kazachstania naganishii CBS 8797]
MIFQVVFSLLLIFFKQSLAGPAATTVAPESIPQNYKESTPYSVETDTVFANHKYMIGVYEYYSSIKYVSNCNPDTTTTTAVGTSSVPIF